MEQPDPYNAAYARMDITKSEINNIFPVWGGFAMMKLLFLLYI